MSKSNRASQLTKAHRVLKKHYKPVPVPTDRTVLEHLLYACCLENARHESADEAFALLQQNYYDWNEVRVTTVAELSEPMSVLPDAGEAATRLKKTLHAVFETYYAFDLEFLKKQNLGKAAKELAKLNGVTSFSLAYVTQCGLGGHSIPVSHGSLRVLYALGVISESEAKQRRVPGMERAIAKSKGVEFGSLLHQLGSDYFVSPFSPRVRAIILEIDPAAKQRLPKRGSKKAQPSSKRPAAKKAAAKSGSRKKSPPSEKKKAGVKKAPAAKKASTKGLSKRKPR